MATVLQPFDGLVAAEFELSIPQRAPFVLDRSVISYMGSTLTETVYTTATHEHRLATTDPALVDQMLRLAMTTPTPRLRFRYGVDGENSKFWMPWQEHLLYAHSATPQSTGERAGHVLLLVTKDRMTEIDRASRVAAHKGKISNIVSAIAQANGIESVIEPTKTDGVYFQNYLSDVEFIRHRLLGRAVNQKGLANYQFYFKDNILHFHTIDYQAELKTISFFNSTGISLVITDNTEKLFDSGIAGVRLIVHDPYTGQSKEVVSNPAQTVRLAQALYPASALPGAQLNLNYHLSTNASDETLGISQSPYSHARLTSLSISMEFTKLVNLRAGDFVNLILTQREADTSPYSGFWFVAEATHNIENGTILSRYALVRGENMKVTTGVAAASSQTQLVPELEAPGQDLNLPEIASSASTKGTGKQTSEKVFATVSDANKGP